MFNYSTIKTGFDGLIGFKDAKDPDIPDLDASITSTSSGLYFSDFHPMVNTDYLEAIAIDYDGANYSSYSGTATYDTGDYVISSDIAWMSKTDDNSGNTPAKGTYLKTVLPAC